MPRSTLRSALGPNPTIQQTAWLTVYGVFCFGVALAASAVALAPLVASLFG